MVSIQNRYNGDIYAFEETTPGRFNLFLRLNGAAGCGQTFKDVTIETINEFVERKVREAKEKHDREHEALAEVQSCLVDL